MKPLSYTKSLVRATTLNTLGCRLLLCSKAAKGSFSKSEHWSVRLAAAASREGSGCCKGSRYCWKKRTLLEAATSTHCVHCSKPEISLVSFFFFPCNSLPCFAISHPFHCHSRAFMHLTLSSQNTQILPVLLKSLAANVTPN